MYVYGNVEGWDSGGGGGGGVGRGAWRHGDSGVLSTKFDTVCNLATCV